MVSRIPEMIRKGLEDPSKIPPFLRSRFIRKTWSFWESLGFHLVPNHFYYPIPNEDDLREKDPWNKKYPTDGIELRETEQLDLLDGFENHISEYSYSYSGSINRADGTVLYSMVREFEPDRIIEVGSGKSTRISLRASDMNMQESGDSTEITAVEPYPDDDLLSLASENEELNLIESRAEDVDISRYLQLESGDFLFIDSSHTLTIGNDVSHLYLKLLPQLPEGVFVHSHDIFFPNEYPKHWTLDKKRFWTEQYLLQAFLMFNDAFEVVWSGQYMYDEYHTEFKQAMPKADSGGGSFWIRRTN